MFRGKKYQEGAKLIDRAKLYDPAEAMETAVKTATAKFDETVEVHVRLGVDSRHADQQVRGAIVLPHGTGLGRGHQTAGAEDLTQTADQAHHVGCGDDHVKVEPTLVLDLGDVLLTAEVVGAGLLGRLEGVALGEGHDAHGLAGAVGQDDRAADLLVGVAGVDAQTDVDLHGLVELGDLGLHGQIHRLVDVIEFAVFDKLAAVGIFLTMFHCHVSSQ